MAFMKIKIEDAQKLADYMSTKPWKEAHPFMVMLNTLEPAEAIAKPVAPGAEAKSPAGKLKAVKAAEANGHAEEKVAESSAPAAEAVAE